MSRWFNISIFVYMFMFGIMMFQHFNMCYFYGSLYPMCSLTSVSGMNRPFLEMKIVPLFGYGIQDYNSNTVNPNDVTAYNSSMQTFVSYKPPPSGITDVFGFFSWVITGGRMLFNAFMLPLIGLPDFFTNQLLFPPFMSYSFGSIIFLLQTSALIEYFTSRWLFQ